MDRQIRWTLYTTFQMLIKNIYDRENSPKGKINVKFFNASLKNKGIYLRQHVVNTYWRKECVIKEMAENTFTWEYQKYNALVVREVPEQLNIENCFYIFIFKNRVCILRPDRINDRQNKYPIKVKLDEPKSQSGLLTEQRWWVTYRSTADLKSHTTKNFHPSINDDIPMHALIESLLEFTSHTMCSIAPRDHEIMYSLGRLIYSCEGY